MKFQSYLNESNTPIEEIISTLKSECGDYVDQIKSLPYLKCSLVSGRNETKLFLKKPIRKDRKSLNTPSEIHNIMNGLFYDKFGIKARSETMFCYFNDINSLSNGNMYGKYYLVFPINKFKLIYSEEVKDLYVDLSGLFFNHFDVVSRDLDEIIKQKQKEVFYIADKHNKDHYMIMNRQIVKSLTKKEFQEMGIEKWSYNEFYDKIINFLEGNFIKTYKIVNKVPGTFKDLNWSTEVMLYTDNVYLINYNGLEEKDKEYFKKEIYGKE